MRRRFIALETVITLYACGACDAYRSPPELESANLERGELDPALGPLELRLSTPIDPATLSIELRLDRRGTEGELCIGDEASRPAGCGGEATLVLGPCTADPGIAERLEDGVKYPCEGGAMIADGELTRLRFETTSRLIPYQRYVLIFAKGLADREGLERGIPLELIFQVKGDLPLAPTDFRPGMFFSVVETFEPISAQFHFFFWIVVNPETGELRAFAADADPADPAVDPKVNRDPSIWVADPNPPSGSNLRASGQVADGPDGRIVHVFPFLLSVPVPPVDAVGAEVGARIRVGTLPAVPGGDREIIEGTMYAPEVFLGLDDQRSALGPGRGTMLLFRLSEEESPPLESLLPVGMTLEDIERAFDD